MNILILSCGTRNKVVHYFKRALQAQGGAVFAADCSPYAPALYDADRPFVVPRMTSPGYVENILDICRREHVGGLLSLIDPELSLLAANAGKFIDIGTKVIGSPHEQCEMALDKWAMYRWLQAHDFSCAKTYLDLATFEQAVAAGEIAFPVFVKPRFGSASLNIAKAEDLQTARFLFSHQRDMLLQEFLNGQEIGADCYVDMISGEPVVIFTKKKLAMRAGETDKAISFKERSLFALICRFLRESGYRAQVDMDLFEIGGKYYISEVNPRFGGGYPHAHECGVDTPSLIVKNLAGQINEPGIDHYESGVVMMKYNELKVIR